MREFLLLLAAIAPALFLVRTFVRRDIFPEPTPHIVMSFLFGIFIIPLILFVAAPMTDFCATIEDAVSRPAATAFLCAAIPEEVFKWLVVAGVCARWSDFDEVMDGIVYGACASLGFACLENVLYVQATGWSTAVIRAVTAVPAHACFGAILGYFVARFRFAREGRIKWLVLSIVVPIVLHGLYDAPLMIVASHESLGSKPTLFLLMLFLGVMTSMLIATMRLVSKVREEQLRLLEAQGSSRGVGT